MSECRQAPTFSSAGVGADGVGGVLDDRHVRPDGRAELGHRQRQPGEVHGHDRAACAPSAPAASVCALTFHVAGSMSAKRGVAPT